MCRDSIQSAISVMPNLTNFGVGIYNNALGLISDEVKVKFQEEKLALLDSSESFIKTVEWLKQIEKTEKFNAKRSSYGLKHVAEKDIGYITNGVFIAAAIHSGFKYRIISDGPNVAFNMSEKSLRKIENKQYERMYKKRSLS
ncbi:hypothetical protein NB545_20050 [Vibrio campbellii]|uniref:hypothetical protein n=1 Tax=Vibrio campbellii TaxID=680 RepID=UPI00215C7D3D|nr:hypothetical protein [Vibrio campbellii]MCR9909731.1 hypothetical protein [Vibrio campbellii]